MKTKYPIYIVSKGRWENPLTAKAFLKDGLDFLIAVEPQEYDNYCDAIGEKYVLKLPFSNLGVGSYPARNYCWEHSIKQGYERHWLFDDNIRKIQRLNKGKRIECKSQIALIAIEEFTDRYENLYISGMDYYKFVMGTYPKPFTLNAHVYSALLIKNDMKYRWRLKYNEDVDLCLQVLNDGYCTALFKAFMVDKVSTTAGMKGGNQTELYDNNNNEKFWIKSKMLQDLWPQFVEVKMKFKRPHHHVNWKKHFKQGLIRRTDIDWEAVKDKKYNIKLKKKQPIKSESLERFYKNEQKTNSTNKTT